MTVLYVKKKNKPSSACMTRLVALHSWHPGPHCCSLKQTWTACDCHLWPQVLSSLPVQQQSPPQRPLHLLWRTLWELLQPSMCVRCELWPWQTLKDKPSVLLSYVHVSWKDRARGGVGVGWEGFGRGVQFLKKEHKICRHRLDNPVCRLCRWFLHWSVATEWSFPSWNTWGSAGVTAQVRSRTTRLCRAHAKTKQKLNQAASFLLICDIFRPEIRSCWLSATYE